jgi:hypothetical protein
MASAFNIVLKKKSYDHFVLKGVCPSQFVIFPDQTGTATSSPDIKTASQSNMNIANVMLWMNETQKSNVARGSLFIQLAS